MCLNFPDFGAEILLIFFCFSRIICLTRAALSFRTNSMLNFIFNMTITDVHSEYSALVELNFDFLQQGPL